MKPLVIGLTGINAVDNPGPGVGVARALKEDSGLDVSLIGLAYDAMEPGVYMDWLIDRSFVLPYPSADQEVYLERLAYIQQSTGLNFIIPSLDVELPFYTKYAPQLEDMGIGVFVPTPEQFRLRGKDSLEPVAKAIGVKIPKSRVVTSHDGLQKAVEDIGLPVMVKGAYYQAWRANTLAEAQHHFNQIAAAWGYPLIIQEVVQGDELNVVAAGDGEGGVLGMVGIKKLTTTALGKIWTGVTIRNEGMLDATDAFIRTYRWRGPLEMECIVSGNEIYLIEINPRFPAWVFFSAGVGVNLPANLVRHATGRPLLDTWGYAPGKLFVRYTYEMITDMNPFQQMIVKGETAHEICL